MVKRCSIILELLAEIDRLKNDYTLLREYQENHVFNLKNKNQTLQIRIETLRCAIKKAVIEEREACAKIAEIHLNQSGYMGGMSGTILQNSTAREIARAIRARGSEGK